MNKDTIPVSGVWFLRRGDDIVLLVEHDGVWKLCATERYDGNFSHCVHPAGIENAPPDPIVGGGTP